MRFAPSAPAPKESAISSERCLETYLQEINEVPLLTPEQERELGAKILDEFSQTSAKLLHADAYRTTMARAALYSLRPDQYAQPDQTWGALPVVCVCGDELQLPPVPFESSLLAPLEGVSDEQKAGVAITDIFTGLYSVIAIQAALRHAEKTGEGQWIDMALMDTQAGVMANQNLNYLVSGKAPSRMGNAHPNIAPYEVFPVADGHVIIAVGNDGQFQRLCGLLGAGDMATDTDFQTNPGRVAAREKLREGLVAQLSTWSKADFLGACEAANVPAGPINTIEEMFADPQMVARGMKQDLTDAAGTAIPGVRTPIILPASPLVYDRPSPRLGEHTDEVLAELGRPTGK